MTALNGLPRWYRFSAGWSRVEVSSSIGRVHIQSRQRAPHLAFVTYKPHVGAGGGVSLRSPAVSSRRWSWKSCSRWS
jgi:hypothetical protein